MDEWIFLTFLHEDRTGTGLLPHPPTHKSISLCALLQKQKSKREQDKISRSVDVGVSNPAPEKNLKRTWKEPEKDLKTTWKNPKVDIGYWSWVIGHWLLVTVLEKEEKYKTRRHFGSVRDYFYSALKFFFFFFVEILLFFFFHSRLWIFNKKKKSIIDKWYICGGASPKKTTAVLHTQLACIR